MTPAIVNVIRGLEHKKVVAGSATVMLRGAELEQLRALLEEQDRQLELYRILAALVRMQLELDHPGPAPALKCRDAIRKVLEILERPARAA